MFNLKIFDVSAFVYTGSTASEFKNRFYFNYPVGGIHYLMRYVTSALADKDYIVLAFDDRDSFRKKIMPCYKEGRKPNKVVISQIQTLYEELSAAGFSCYRFSECEGDDIVSWACTQNMKKHDEVIIYGNDRDLLHNVRGNVRFRSITPSVNSVWEGSFSDAIELGKHIPFNTISVNKVLEGCSSDKVPPFVSEKGYKGEYLYNVYLQALRVNNVPFSWENTTNKDLFMQVFRQIDLITDADLVELDKRIKVIFPADCPAGVEIVPNTRKDIDPDVFAYFLSMYNDYSSSVMMQYRKRDLTEADKKLLRDKAYALSSGAYAVDKEIDVHDVDQLGSCLFLKEFD